VIIMRSTLLSPHEFATLHVLVAMFIWNFKKKLSQIFKIVTFGLVKTNKVINVNHVEIILKSSWS
jgi:hypothetical protein